MSVSFSFKESQVFVFGGTSGINLGIARCFAAAGADVAVASRSQEKVDAAVEELKALGSNSSGYALDVRDAEAVEAALAEHSGKSGDLDVLVSGAAGNFPALANDMSPNGFKSVVDIDLLGSFHVLRSAFQYLRKPGASVINISAPQAFLAMPMQSHVCAAKAGVDMLTRTLALEWGPYGIRINSIAPGPIADTEGMRRLAPSEAIANQYKKSVPSRPLRFIRGDRQCSNVPLLIGRGVCQRCRASGRWWLVSCRRKRGCSCNGTARKQLGSATADTGNSSHRSSQSL